MKKVRPSTTARLTASAFLAALAGSAIVLGTLLAATARGFLDVETELARAAARRAALAVERECSRTATMVADYARWDDCHDYVRGLRPDFFAVNFTEESLGNLGVDFVAIYGPSGKLLDSLARREGPWPIAPDRPDAGAPDSASAAIIASDGGFYAVAHESATRSDGSGPPVGRVVFGLAVDGAFAARVAETYGIDLSLRPFESGRDAPGSSRVDRNGLSRPVVSSLPLEASGGVPLLVVEVAEPRTIARRGLRALAVVAAGAVAALLGSFAFLALEARRVLIAPLERLEGAVTAMGSGDRRFDTELEILEFRGDLVGRTAAVLRKASREIKMNLEMERTAGARLENQVRERTAELFSANRELQVYKRIMDETSEGIILTDLDGRIQEANPAFCKLAGYELHELIGQNPRVLKSGRHDADFYRAMWDAIATSGRWEGEIWNRRKDGTVYPKLLSIDTIRDEEGRPERYVGLSADISKLKEAEESLNRLAFYDPLTGLPNRALFTDRFSQALARSKRESARAALLYLDLDHFKDVNDTLGHQAGDDLLKEAARRLSNQVRGTDTVCRLGGDEFTVILENIKRSADAEAVARKIIEALQFPFRVAGNEVYVGASVGIALYPFDGVDFDDLVKHADAAMYEAKEKGRGQLRFASGAAGSTSRRRLEAETLLRRGLERGDFVLQYQPQVSAGGAEVGSSSGLIGAEALVRMKAEDGKIIPPDAFIETAEETGLIVPLGAWVLQEAGKEAARWAAAGTPVIVSVNVSQRQFDRGIIVDQVARTLESTGLRPDLLKLEVTESLFMSDIEKAASIMRELMKLGVSFAIDDFGVGYSSLRYIDTLPIDTLKIDKSFIQRISTRFDGGEVAMAIVSMARSFGLSSIAEGVETADQLDALRMRGCDAIQGYFVSKPLDAADFRAFIAAGGEEAVLEEA